MSETQPSITTVKLLFAHSGNRCAYPKCRAPMAQGDTLLGEMCHIRGKNPGSARYDPGQMPEQRNEYYNLILLCPTHHTVIDADTDAYTVERLERMRAGHEASTAEVSDSEAQRVAAAYVATSGGIAAQTVTAHNITLNSGPVLDPIAQRRQMQAIECLWQMICALRAEFGSVVFVDTILLPSEMAAYFKNGSSSEVMECVREYADINCAARKFQSINPDPERPFVSHRVWAVLHVIRAIYARAGALIALSYKKRAYEDWRTDSGCDQLFRSVLPGHLVDGLQQKKFGGLREAIDILESQFLSESGMQKH